MRRGAGLLALAVLVAACGGGDSTSTTGAVPAPATAPEPAPDRPEGVPSFPPDEFATARSEMVDMQLEARGVTDAAVLQAMREVPRHLFVPAEYVGEAYDDHPLPIGFGQTISQPYIVGLMSEELGVSPGDRVLEVGTGSGYQAAILGQMGLEVYTVEIIPELALRATTLLGELSYGTVFATRADGYFGWPEHAPFDAIIVTAAPDHVPQPLVQQLAPGASMVIPVGPIGAVQTLWRFTVDAEGELIATNLGGVRFVPLTGGPDAG